MRMPVLSYFLIVGAALFGVLTLVSNRIEPKPLPVTQTIGLRPPYKAPPEDAHSAAPSTVNLHRNIDTLAMCDSPANGLTV
jgi:hypothetical protein